jgi:lysozyme
MIVPKSTPRQSHADTLRLLAAHNIKDKVAIVGIRGYYKDTMGKKGQNDRGIYDDAIFIIAPECYVSFNANCDPGAFRKGIANLKAGVWKYKIGVHGLSKPKPLRYKALVQADKVTVARDNVGDETGFFGINIHRGQRSSTSSLGCQTIYPDQWSSFIETIQAQLERHEQRVVPYLLVEL